jgi:hypothetical protein
MSDNTKNWSDAQYRMWRERHGWQGYGTKKEEEELRKWAKDVLHIPLWTRAIHKVLWTLAKFSPKKFA